MPLPKDLSDAWAETERTGKPVDIGRIVVCDSCSKDCTDLPDEGGLVFGSSAYGPCCVKRIEADARRFGELSYICARCPVGVSFADFIRAYRAAGSGNTVQVTRR